MALNAASIYCPICHRHTALSQAPIEAACRRCGDALYVPAVWQQGFQNTWWMGLCNACHDPVIVHQLGQDIVEIYPPPFPPPTDDRIPNDMRADLDEAKRCFGISAWRAAAVMARRAIQSAAIAKGASAKDRLQEQIDKLAQDGQITKDLAECAHAVRFVGNDGAHPGGEPVAQEDAEAVLQLAEQLLHLLYVTPAIAQDVRKKRGKEARGK